MAPPKKLLTTPADVPPLQTELALMKQLLLLFRPLFARLGFFSAPQPRQLDFLSTLETPGYPRERERHPRLSK